MNEDLHIESGLVGITEIARIFGKGPSTVSNWRRRYPGSFPQPRMETPSGDLFSLDEVEDWLLAEGKTKQRVASKHKFLTFLRGLRQELSASALLELARASLVFASALVREYPNPDAHLRNELADGRPAQALKRVSRSLESSLPEAEGLTSPESTSSGANANPGQRVNLIYLAIEALRNSAPEDLFDDAIEAASGDDRQLAAFSTPSSLVELVSRLAGDAPESVLDPAAGSGRLLFGVVSRTDATVALANDLNEEGAKLVRSRFFVAGRRLDRLTRTDALSDPSIDDSEADVVVIDPPFGRSHWASSDVYRSQRWRFGAAPPNHESLAWIQLGCLAAGTGGSAYVLAPSGAAERGGVEQRIRQNLVRAGVVEAIVALPSRLRLDAGLPFDLWILRSWSSPDPDAPVLMVDASMLATSGKERQAIPVEAIERVVSVVDRWRRSRDVLDQDTDIAASVAATDLDDGELAPGIYVGGSEVDLEMLRQEAFDTTEILTDLNLDFRAVRPEIEALHPVSPNVPKLPLGQIAKVIQGQGLSAGSTHTGASEDQIQVLGARELTRGAARYVDPGSSERHLVMLRGGDVVFCLSGDRIIARVIEEGDLVLGPGAVLIRSSDPESLDPDWIYLFLTARGTLTKSMGRRGVASRISAKDVRQLEIRLPPIEEQRRLGGLVRSIEAARNSAEFAEKFLANMVSAAGAIVLSDEWVDGE